MELKCTSNGAKITKSFIQQLTSLHVTINAASNQLSYLNQL